MKHSNQVDVPLVFFSLAFFIILFGLFSRFSFQSKKYVEPKLQQIVSPITSKKKLNYNLPLICNYHTNNSTISASLKDASAAVIVAQDAQEKRYVLEGDCIFSWEKKAVVGKKQCGVGQYLGIARQLLGSGLASADSLGVLATQAGKSIPFDIGSLLQSCKNVKDVEKEKFLIPKEIIFKQI